MTVHLLEALAILLAVLALGLALWLFWSLRHAEGRAARMLMAWKEQDLEIVKREISEAARREAGALLDEWKIQTELAIRQDAVLRSQSVTIGRVSEHIAPFMPGFPYNPKDARFIGSPIDIIVFDGADEGMVEQVVFIEVKSAGSTLTPRQRQVRDAVSAGRVAWRELRV